MPKPTKDELERLYVKEQKSLNDIADGLAIHASTVARWLESYSIPRRDRLEAVALQKKLASEETAQLEKEPEAKLAIASASQTSGILDYVSGEAKPAETLEDELLDESPWARLSDKQIDAIELLASLADDDLKKTDIQKAKQLNINPLTLAKWKRDPLFRECLEEYSKSEFVATLKGLSRTDLIQRYRNGTASREERINAFKLTGDLDERTQVNVGVQAVFREGGMGRF